MRHFRAVTVAVALLGSAGPLALRAATVDFETEAIGTRWGGAFGRSPNEVVLTQDRIDMSVELFFLDETPVDFDLSVAEIGGPFQDFFPTTPLDLNNISVRFHFDDLGFSVNQLTLDYQEFGVGNENFSVNGGELFIVEALIDTPTEVAPDVTALIDETTITLTGGPIDFFTIGGQELAIDNVTAIPEPATILLLALGAATVLRRRGRA